MTTIVALSAGVVAARVAVFFAFLFAILPPMNSAARRADVCMLFLLTISLGRYATGVAQKGKRAEFIPEGRRCQLLLGAPIGRDSGFAWTGFGKLNSIHIYTVRQFLSSEGAAVFFS